MAKKGQLTVFVIIGILLLLLIAIVLYMQRERAVAPVEAERIRLMEVPETVRPINDFVQTCLHTVAKQGVQIIGERGGYIEPKQRYNPYEVTEGSAVQFAPESELKVPYWWHLSSNNDCGSDCVFDTERPALSRAEGGSQSIEGQLDTYIAEALPDCLGTFTQFSEQQFTITPTGPLKPRTDITTGNVIVFLDHPLDIERSGERFTLKDFVTELPVNLYEIYQLATNITNLQATHSFLERATRNLIDVFGRTREDALPPVAEMEFGFGSGTIWTKFEIEDKLKQMLTSYIPLLRVLNTRNYRYFPAPLGTNRALYEVLYNRGFTVPVLDSHHGLNAKFVYLPWWKPYFDLNCNGQVCQSDGFSNTFGFLFGVRRYTFAYDISYPVLVQLENPDAYGGEGYSFRFFLEANMRNNEPLAVVKEPLTVTPIADTGTLLCDENQRTGGNVTLNVRTSAGQPVDGAEILYRCGTETCGIGTTVNGKLVAPFPRCFGGILSAAHIDYAQVSKPFDVLDATPQTTDLTLGVPYTVDFTVRKWLIKKQFEEITTFGGLTQTVDKGWDLDRTQVVNQGPRENTIIMLDKKGDPFAEPVIVIGEICGAPVAKASIPCGTPPSDNSKEITMYSGDYHVTIYSFMYPSPDLIIPPDRRCVSRGPGRSQKCFRIPPRNIVFNTEKPLYSGLAEYDWTVTENELKNAKNIEFYYFNFALDKVQPATRRKIEDLNVMGDLSSYSEQYRDLLKPHIT